MSKTSTMLVTLALGATFAFAGPAFADKMTVTLDGKAAAVPSAGKGTADLDYDPASKKLSWKLTYSGLSGPATAAHFHGPAEVGANAPPVVPIEGSLASPIKGTATLTDEQAGQLKGGMWYFNVHTAKFPDGEIRGQVMTAGAM